jgi:capsular polysaccharide biosynthesis protein
MTAELHAGARRLAGPEKQERAGRTALWISRQDAPNRRLLNEVELIAAARSILGEIEVVTLSRTSLAEQARQLDRAWCILGAKGQGLTNLLFAQNRLALILQEGSPNTARGWDAIYRDVAELGGNPAARLFSGTPLGENNDWHYPCEKFAADLRRAVEAHRRL